MANSFLLLVLLSTVVLSDFAGPCQCGLNKHDEDPLSCSCYVCIKAPANHVSTALPRGYAINAATDLVRGPTYAGQFANAPARAVAALYANPARRLCPPMLNTDHHYPLKQQPPPDYQFLPHATFHKEYVWQIMVQNNWWASAPQLFFDFGDRKGLKRTDGHFYFSAWDVVKKDLLKMRQPLSELFETTTFGKKPKNPCPDRTSFAICTYNVVANPPPTEVHNFGIVAQVNHGDDSDDESSKSESKGLADYDPQRNLMNGGNANHNGIHPNNGNGVISSIGNGLIPNNGNPQNNGNYANGPINGQVHVVPNQWQPHYQGKVPQYQNLRRKQTHQLWSDIGHHEKAEEDLLKDIHVDMAKEDTGHALSQSLNHSPQQGNQVNMQSMAHPPSNHHPPMNPMTQHGGNGNNHSMCQNHQPDGLYNDYDQKQQPVPEHSDLPNQQAPHLGAYDSMHSVDALLHQNEGDETIVGHGHSLSDDHGGHSLSSLHDHEGDETIVLHKAKERYYNKMDSEYYDYDDDEDGNDDWYGMNEDGYYYEDDSENGDEDWYRMDEGYYYGDDEDEMDDQYYKGLLLYEEAVRNVKKAEQLKTKAAALLRMDQRERRY